MFTVSPAAKAAKAVRRVIKRDGNSSDDRLPSMDSSRGVSKRRAEHEIGARGLSRGVCVTSSDECCNPGALKGEIGMAFCKGQVHFVCAHTHEHTVHVMNDLPHDNCTNKLFGRCMPLSVRRS